jgi:predicted HTH transcriptional regulator
MPTLIIIITILLLAVIVLTTALMEAKKYGTKTKEELVDICNTVFDQNIKKQENLAKILTMFETDSELTNTEIRNALKVSSRTVVRYMDELEKEGKVMQVGKVGYTVTYRRSAL